MKLTEIAELRPGYNFRGKIEHHPGAEVAVIQLKDLEKNHTCFGDSIFRVPQEEVNPRHYLRPGDVLLVAKGSINRAIVYNLDIPAAVATSVFYIFRPDPERLHPNFLRWYLNHPRTQNYLRLQLTGSYTLNLNRPALAQISLELPPLPTQKSIAAVDELLEREQSLMQRLTERKQLYRQEQLYLKANL